jgi:hypothetical protein
MLLDSIVSSNIFNPKLPSASESLSTSEINAVQLGIFYNKPFINIIFKTDMSQKEKKACKKGTES